MKKKILIKAPILSRSGYGEQSRFALQALRSREDLFDIYLVNIPWGKTGQTISTDAERQWIDDCILKTMMYTQQPGSQFDISLQVTIPNEFEKIAPVNVGYTAGIETTKIAAEWIDKCNAMVDRVVVVSNHSKKVFENTKYNVKDQHGNDVPNWGINVPVEAINYCVRLHEPESVALDLTTDNNFLVVSQWGPRKNVDNTIKWFMDVFKDDPTAGLVLKTNTVSDSITDRIYTGNRLEALLRAYPDHKCKVYLVHGDLTPDQLAWLYQHPKMKALINIGHGEGFGLPLFEAACNGLPLITTTWSGQMDFICVPNKKGKQVPKVVPVNYDVQPVQKEAVWKGVIVEDSMWAYPKEASYKRALTACIEKEKHYKQEAKRLQKHILENFTTEKMHEQFVEFVYGEKVKKIEIEELPKISLITSVYNAAEYIEQLMEDTTAQSIFDKKCEWILINANEKGDDFEEKIILEYAAKYPNIIYKRLETDPGVYGVWNEAIKMASGEFITNINCDDRRESRALEKQATTLLANPDVGLVYNDSYISHEANVRWGDIDRTNAQRYNFDQFSADAMMRGNLPHNNPMWRKSLHAEYGYFDEKYRSAGDWDFWLRCAFGGAQFIKHPEILGVYYFNPTGLSTNPDYNSWKKKDEFEIFKKYQKLFLLEK